MLRISLCIGLFDNQKQPLLLSVRLEEQRGVAAVVHRARSRFGGWERGRRCRGRERGGGGGGTTGGKKKLK